MSVELTILVDNAANDPSLAAEHGLSILIRGPSRNVLFDTGGSEDVLAANARQLGVDLATVNTAVISHGHCDHTGALLNMARRGGLDIFAHATAFCRRWADVPGQSLRDISCPWAPQRLTQTGARIHYIQAPEMLDEWLILSGPVGGPPCGDPNFVIRKGEELVVDRFEDEMFVLVKGADGWTIVSGCCHRGLANTLRMAKFLTRGQPIVNMAGGLHLHKATDEELAATVAFLKQHEPLELYPCHCTGQRAIDYIKLHLPSHVHDAKAGTRIVV